MGKIHAMMDIGKRAMMNSQSALQTVAHNIANKTTEGYSRQRVEQVTAPPINEGRLQMGMGARASLVTRITNPFLDRQVQVETGILGYHEGKAEAMQRVEQTFNEQTTKGLNQYINDFFNAFRELSNNPESQTSRVVVKETSQALAEDFVRINKQLESSSKEVDLQVKQYAEEINKMCAEVATLNEKIAGVEMHGLIANDERDRRDLLVKQLHEKIDIKVADGDNGMIHISTAGNALMVSGVDSYQLKTGFDDVSKRTHLYFQSSPTVQAFDITDRVKGGKLGGALEVRDTIIPGILDNMDRIADTLAYEVNSAHVRGFDKNGAQGTELFKFDNGEGGASNNIRVSEDILDNVSKIAAGAKPNAIGDNTVANVISMLQFQQVMDGSTIDDYYTSEVGRVGVIANRAVKSKEAQDNILKQVATLRESVSGVSLDEEATKMIEYQKAFDASARVIKTADEMFDTVLNLKRM